MPDEFGDLGSKLQPQSRWKIVSHSFDQYELGPGDRIRSGASSTDVAHTIGNGTENSLFLQQQACYPKNGKSPRTSREELVPVGAEGFSPRFTRSK